MLNASSNSNEKSPIAWKIY